MLQKLDQEKERLELLQKVRNDPWEFSKYVFTIDESDKVNPKKRFPYHLAYIKLFFKILMKEQITLVPKSRRMKMTWTCIVFFLWDTMFHGGRHNAIVSKKEDDADWLIQKRFKYVYDNLDPALPKELLPKATYKYNKLMFEEISSYLQGFPQGENQLRMYTLSNIFADELAFWEKAEGTYSGAKPTLEGGGRFVGISSPAPGFLKRMVFDRLDSTATVSEAMQQAVEKKSPMQGIEMWKNKKNGFFVFQLHYTADPAKRSAEYKQSIQRGMSKKKFQQEYELAWDVYSGYPVYTDFYKTLHVSRKKLHPHFGLPLLRGWDFGLTPACIIAQYREGQFVVLKEFFAIGMGIKRFCPEVLRECQILFPQWADQKKDFLDLIDPAGFNRAETDETTCAQHMSAFGLAPQPGGLTWTDRVESVEDLLTEVKGGNPSFLMNEVECELLLKGFEGGYRYPESSIEIEPGKARPYKDKHSHPHDALQMITTKLNMVLSRHVRRSVPRADYSFLKGGRNGRR